MTTIRNLRCEHLSQPLGISTAIPRFGWELESSCHDIRQVAYRVLVGTSPQVSEGDGDLFWDSGKVNLDSQHEILYAGRPLQIRTGYYWKVKVWLESQGEVDWSEASYFETGFFNINDWDCNWASYRWTHLVRPDRTVIHLRNEFTVAEKPVKRARLYVASTSGYEYDDTLRMNLYTVRMNGEKVGKDYYNPGQISDRRGRALYRTYDVTAQLNRGSNVVGVVYLSAKISFQLYIEYTDGTVQQVNDSEQWRWFDQGPYVRLWRTDIDEHGGKSEIYDARNEYTGWDQPGYNAAKWRPILPTNPAEMLVAQMQGVEVSETLHPVSILKREPGRYVVDFGRNSNGFVTLKVKGDVGARIRIRHSEYAWESGDIDVISTLGSRNPEGHIHEDVYIKRSNEVETYAPLFAMHAFRYVEISNYGGELTAEDVIAHFAHSTVLNGSEFRCSDNWVQRLHDIGVRSCLSNLTSVPTDCPSRERQGWLGDAGLCLSLVESTNFDMRLFYEKWFNDICDMQEANGFLPYIAPFRTQGLSGKDIPWATGAVTAAWTAYVQYGDKTFLTQFYPMLKKWAGYVDALPLKDGLSHGNSRWNDHLSAVYSPIDFVENIYCYRTFDLFAKVADALGNESDRNHYRQRANERREAINARYLDAQDRYIAENVQSSNAQALYFGIVPEERRAGVFARIVESLEKEQSFTTGILGTFCLVMALAEQGRNDLMYRLVKSDAPRTWGYWLKEYDATTVMEYWVHDPHVRGGTHNHPALIGGLGAWFYQELAGIKPTLPGYKSVCIRPYCPEGLEQVSATVQSVYGPLSASWQQKDNRLSMDVIIPPGVTAEIHVPGREPVQANRISEGQSESLTGTTPRVYIVGSGRYTFSCQSGK